ncbi:MAG: hypothetical protein SFT90_01750, partial [Rickettsiales bacterium]|nr:hypothetical protein [Rickettsiales bacterium]
MKFNHKLEDLIRNLLKEIPSLAENGCFGDFCSKVDSVNHLFLSAVNRKYPNIDDKSTTYIPTRLWEDFVERIEDASLKEKLQVFKKRNLSFFGKQNKPVVSFNTPNIKSLT